MLRGRGRKRCIVIYGRSRRPAFTSTRIFLAMPIFVRTGRLMNAEDQRAVAGG